MTYHVRPDAQDAHLHHKTHYTNIHPVPRIEYLIIIFSKPWQRMSVNVKCAAHMNLNPLASSFFLLSAVAWGIAWLPCVLHI
jgi:hypothetical protein